MILGSFQIDQEFELPHTKFPDLHSELGYYPRFCFRADSDKNVIKYGLLAAPNSVDNLFIFETDEFQLLDSVSWNQYLITHSQADLKNSLMNPNLEHSEYLVRSISNYKYRLRPQKWMPKAPSYTSSFEMTKSWAIKEQGEQSLLSQYCDFCIHEEHDFIEEFVKPRLNREFDNSYHRLIAAITIFKLDYLFFHYSFNTLMIDYRSQTRNDRMFDERIPQFPVFNWRSYFKQDIPQEIADFCNEDQDLTYKSREKYVHICSEIDSLFSTIDQHL